MKQRIGIIKGLLYLSIYFSVVLGGLTFTEAETSTIQVNSQTIADKKRNSVYVVSADELNKFSNTKDILKELEMLRQHRDSLLEYSKKLKNRFDRLEREFRNRSSKSESEREADINSSFEQTIQALRQSNENIKTEYEALKIKYSALEVDADNKTKNFTSIIENKDNEREEADQLIRKTEGELEGIKTRLKQKEEESHACFEQLEQSQKLIMRIPELEQELLSIKGDHLLRATAAELLGYAPPSDVTKELNAKTNTEKLKSIEDSRPAKKMGSGPLNLQAPAGLIASDVTVVEVTGDRVALRAGPGLKHSSVMDISRGARLTVESKEGVWYRINSPTGGRAYIHSDYAKVVSTGLNDSVQAASRTKLIPEAIEPYKPPLPSGPALRKLGKNAKAGSESDTLESLALRQLRSGLEKK